MHDTAESEPSLIAREGRSRPLTVRRGSSVKDPSKIETTLTCLDERCRAHVAARQGYESYWLRIQLVVLLEWSSFVCQEMRARKEAGGCRREVLLAKVCSVVNLLDEVFVWSLRQPHVHPHPPAAAEEGRGRVEQVHEEQPAHQVQLRAPRQLPLRQMVGGLGAQLLG